MVRAVKRVAVAIVLSVLSTVGYAMSFNEHKDNICKQQKVSEDCGKLRSSATPNACWAYWSDTDSLEQCKEACIRLHCPCFGYLSTDPGYFHKCRIINPDIYAGETARSSVAFVAYIPTGSFPLLTDPENAWTGWVFLLLLGLYLGVGSAHGFVKGRRGIAMIPHLTRWRAVVALAKDGAAYCRSCVFGGRTRHRHAGEITTPIAGNSGKQRSPGSAADKKKKKSRKSKKAPKSDKNVDNRNQKMATSDDSSASASQAPEWKPTRTGHLAVGARETGVKVVG